MAAVNSTVSQADYNSIRNKIVNVMGGGYADYGWGQSSKIKSSAVNTGDSVTINEWSKLRYDIINAWTHITGSAPTTAQVAEGNTIRYTSNFTPDTGTLDVPVYQYDAWANSIVANRFTIGSGQYATVVPSSPLVSGYTFNYQISSTIDCYWPDANMARFFFNSGGKVQIAASFVPGVGTAQNIAWQSLLSTAGTQSFGGNTPGTGTTPNDGQNWYRTNQSFQQWYTISSSSPYSANNYKIYARCVDVTSNSSGTSSWGQFKLVFTDGYTDPGTVRQPGESVARNPADFPPDDVVSGTFTISVSLLYPSGVFVPAGTGNFSVTLPTIAIGGLQ